MCIKFLKYPVYPKALMARESLRQRVTEAPTIILVLFSGLAGSQGMWQATQAFAGVVFPGVPGTESSTKKDKLSKSISNQSK